MAGQQAAGGGGAGAADTVEETTRFAPRFDAAGLVTCVTVRAADDRVLMVAHMNAEALHRTLESGVVHYWSRSRGQLWRKGETSGHVQQVQSIKLDCDGDTIVLGVEQVGGIACHTGRRSCFYRTLVDGEWATQSAVLKDPSEMYQS